MDLRGKITDECSTSKRGGKFPAPNVSFLFRGDAVYLQYLITVVVDDLNGDLTLRG